MEDDNFSSDTSDEDYVPYAGEQVSEEEESGVDEDFEPSAIVEEAKLDRRRSDKKKNSKLAKSCLPRKHRGGIKLSGEHSEATVQEELSSSTLSEDLTTEPSTEIESHKEQKHKADSLWANFLNDVANVPRKSQFKSTSACSGSACNSSITDSEFPQPAANSVKLTKEYDSAGETVIIVKDVATDLQEGRQALHSAVGSDSSALKIASSSVLKRPTSAAGLDSVLGKIGKKPKISVLEKSKVDWDGFKQEEGISEELTTHNRGKDGYLERQAFLLRTDFRQFEIERKLRLSSSSTLPSTSKR